MSEDKTVSQSDIDAVAAEIQKKQAEAFKSKAEEQAKEIEEKVRKEMEVKLEAEKLKEQLAKQGEELKKMREEQDARMKAQEEAFKKQLEDIMNVKKGVTKNESPFAKTDDSKMVRLPDGSEIDVNNLDHDAIEEQSRIAFMQRFGIQNPDFGKPMVRYK